MQSCFFIPIRKLWSPRFEVGPHQVAELSDFLLGIELGAKIHEMQEGPEREAHHEMLPVIKGKDAAGMFLGVAGLKQFLIAIGADFAVV